MAIPSIKLINAIKSAARRLSKSPDYQWGHMGSCNCGFLAQEITKLTKGEIHRRAMNGHGDWTEQLKDYCPTSGLLMDDLISDLLTNGLSIEDMQHLEKLSDPFILENTASLSRELKHNVRKDVVEYMTTWADLLESSLIREIDLPKMDNLNPTKEYFESSKF